jgi:type II secretory pathway pseudopilin PulG
LILVMALLLIVMAVSFPSLKGFFRGRTLDSEARRLLSLTRYAQSRAVAEGVPMVLWIDARERTYGLQTEEGFVELDRKAVEYELGDGLTVEISQPADLGALSQRKRNAVQAANLPAIRINAEGFIDSTSPEAIQIREGEARDSATLWVAQSGNRLNYEILSQPPATLRR